MDMKKSKKLLMYLAAAYWALAIMIYLVAHPQFRYTNVVSNALSRSMLVGEVIDGMEIRQNVVVPADELQSISLLTTTLSRENHGAMQLTLSDARGNQLAAQTVDLSVFEDNQYATIKLSESIVGCKGETLLLTIVTQGCSPGNALAIYAGNTVATGRFDIEQNIPESERYYVDGQMGDGKLCVKLSGVDELSFYKTYWLIVAGIFSACAVLCAYWWNQAKKNKNNALVTLCTMCTRYGFLIKQLVGRDFKTKYKRSMLGMAWSFLNPLLMMCVQYFVFSTLFQSDIPNYAVYLVIGIVFMNFFNEAVSMGMMSITSNAALIKKVYVPKYIYPISRILSSLVNFVIALLPLIVVMLFNGIMPSWALLLMVFDLICLMGFITGMGLLLATTMTFFQDTQFLWGVASTMWMYLTPIFYPESIIPDNMITVFRMNPMYQYITFARTCIMEGVSPAPLSYLWCIISSLLMFVLGIVVFKKNQDKFVLYL